MKTNDLGPEPTATGGLYARGETNPGGSPASDDDLDDEVQDLADKGLCAIEYGSGDSARVPWCVTHGVVASIDHALTQPGQQLD
jgi:hypothetical protein